MWPRYSGTAATGRAGLYRGKGGNCLRTVGGVTGVASLEFWVFGAVEAVRDGQVLPLGRGKLLDLFAALLTSPDRIVTGEVLADMVWHLRLIQRFDALRAEALPKRVSRDLIMKVAAERWT